MLELKKSNSWGFGGISCASETNLSANSDRSESTLDLDRPE
jgi:hypothetical protein